MKSNIVKNYNLPVMRIRGNPDFISYPVFAEIKLDGELQFLKVSNGEALLFNKPKYGRIRYDCPITEMARDLPNCLLVGELYYGEGKDFYELLRHKVDNDLKIAVFDILTYQGKDLKDLPYSKRKLYLYELGLKFFDHIYPRINDPITLIYSKLIPFEEALIKYKDEIINYGYEGLVLKRGDSTYFDGQTGKWWKLKKELTADLPVIGFAKKAKILSLLLGIKRGSKLEPLAFVGGGFSLKEKETLREVLSKHIVGETKDAYLVKPCLMVEVTHQGVIKSSDGKISSLRHPIFKRFRFDKTLDDYSLI